MRRSLHVNNACVYYTTYSCSSERTSSEAKVAAVSPSTLAMEALAPAFSCQAQRHRDLTTTLTVPVTMRTGTMPPAMDAPAQ
jgi:hypothetical protein